MGIYIKGQVLPPKGEHYLLQINSDGTVYDAVGHRTAAHAVPVPPHGRLIDADAVSLEGGPYEYDEWCKWALEQYQDAPTVIPAEDGE